MDIEIVIPVQKQTQQLIDCIDSINQHTEVSYILNVLERPDLNVAEARQVALDQARLPYVCFLDDDVIIQDQGWLQKMVDAFQENTVCTFGQEIWGTDPEPLGLPDDTPIPGDKGQPPLEYGPAACMMVRVDRVPQQIKWDPYIGLNNGWLGGDLEEVDFCFKLREAGLHLRIADTTFLHKGGKTRFWDHRKTDRYKTMITMMKLLHYKYRYAPQDGDWFKDFHYVKADINDDNMLAPGSNLRDCYKDVIARNGLSGKRFFIKHGLV